MNKKLLAIPLAAAVAAAISIAATNTGANFSGTSNTGTISGKYALVKVLGSGGTGESGMDIKFANPLVPGEAQSVSTYFTNSGNVNEDIYVVFNSPKALHAFDQQGRYASASISVQGGQPLWQSSNLNDGLQNGQTPAYDCHTQTNVGTKQICPLPAVQQLLTNVAPGGKFYWTFTYQPTGSMQDPAHQVGNSSQGAPFNPWPVDNGGNVSAASTNSGLPYEFYAVPTGQPGPVVPLSVS